MVIVFRMVERIGVGVAETQGDTLRGTWGTGGAKQGAGEFIGVRQKRDKTSP
jgi:hypothetical protein